MTIKKKLSYYKRCWMHEEYVIALVVLPIVAPNELLRLIDLAMKKSVGIAHNMTCLSFLTLIAKRRRFVYEFSVAYQMN